MADQPSLITGDVDSRPGLIYMLDSDRIPESHPTEWLRGRQLVGVAVDDVSGLVTKTPVELVTLDDLTRLRDEMAAAKARIVQLEDLLAAAKAEVVVANARARDGF